MRRLTRWEQLGLYFGFPVCCISAFVQDNCHSTKTTYPTGPWVGTGFIPCLTCAEKAMHFDNFVKEVITPNRSCSLPFPLDPDNEVIDELIAQWDTLNLGSLASGT